MPVEASEAPSVLQEGDTIQLKEIVVQEDQNKKTVNSLSWRQKAKLWCALGALNVLKVSALMLALYPMYLKLTQPVEEFDDSAGASVPLSAISGSVYGSSHYLSGRSFTALPKVNTFNPLGLVPYFYPGEMRPIRP